MSARAKKLTQKELKQPDEFVTASGKVVQWAKENQSTVQYGAIGLVALLILISLAGWWNSSRNASANQQFYSAIELYQADQWQEAYDGFSALAGSLGGTDYGRLATLYAGRAALQLDKPDEAIKFYKEYLGGSTTVSLEQLARLNLGRALAKKGDTAGAKSELDSALSLSGPAKPEVTLELAAVEESVGAKDRALDLYAAYLNDNPQAPAKEFARARIMALGGELPAPANPGFGGINPLQFQTQ
ncbi:MAG: tetratricopeptide repeat protein [Candidatus Binatia bacterium]|nr:tetratricopeptide repeat protein [Candidatus Binatia bacterium]